MNAGENVANDFDSLVLDAQYNYTFHSNNTTRQGPYSTYIHDQTVADLQNLAGGQAPHGRWVHLYINGMYWGIYNAHERPTDAFAEEYYGGDKDDYLSLIHICELPLARSGDDVCVAYPCSTKQLSGSFDTVSMVLQIEPNAIEPKGTYQFEDRRIGQAQVGAECCFPSIKLFPNSALTHSPLLLGQLSLFWKEASIQLLNR